MPPGKHLSWFEIKDFTPGLWEEGGGTHQKVAAPPNSFKELVNYRPMKGGGLRAFVKGKTTQGDNTTAIANGIGTDETIMGVMVHGGVVTRPGKNGGSILSGNGVDSQLLLATTIDRTSHKARIRRLDLSDDSTAWGQLFINATGASGNNHQTPGFAIFHTTAGDVWDLVTIIGGLSTDFGLYTVGYQGGAGGSGIDGDVAKLTSHHGPLAVLQARILIAGGDTIFYSLPGVTTLSDIEQFLSVSPNRQLTDISGLAGMDPSDLLVMKEGAPWASITGDISAASVSVREMGDDHHGRQNQQPLIRVPGGVAFIEPEGRVFITDGRTFRSISDQLSDFPLVSQSMVGPGSMGYANDLLFAGRGMVYDFETGAWFRQNSLPTGRNWSFDAYFGEMYGTGQNAGETDFEGNVVTTARSVAVFPMFPTASTDYASDGYFTTQPFSDANGRNVAVREVQVFSKPHRTGSTIAVEVFGADGTSLGVSTRTLEASDVPTMSAHLFPGLKSPYAYIKFTLSSGGTSEAPTIERIRIGFDGNNSLSLPNA